MTPKSLRTNRKRFRFFGSVVLMLTMVLGPGSAFSALAASAQENTGSIQGVVKDQAGAVLPGAKVTATSPTSVRPFEAIADSTGYYIFPKLPAGVYTVSASQSGFKTVNKEQISVVLGKELTLDIEMPTGQVTEAVTVTASDEAIDVTSSKTATNITDEFIEKTPKGRNFHTILQVAPGVRSEPKAGTAGVGGFQIDGASGSENTFIIDGVDVSNVRRGSLDSASSIPFEFIKEIQVKSAGFEAEFGGATGGVVNVVTRSGGNDFHGEVALMFTGAALNSSPRGFFQRNPTDVTKAEFFKPKEDEYQSFFPGVTLSGPIIKERLNFFTSYFPEFTRTQRTVTFAKDNSTRSFNRRDIQHFGIGRLDYAPTQKIQINTSYLWTPTRVEGLLTGTDGRIAPPSNDLSVAGGYDMSNAYNASFTYVATDRLILGARYGYKFNNNHANPYGKSGLPLLSYQTNSSKQVSPSVPSALAGAAGFQNVSSTFLVEKDVTTRHNVYLDGSYIARVFGQQHTFKGGYQLNRIANDVKDDFTNGFFQIFWGDDFSRGSIAHERGTYGYYIWQDGVRHEAKVSSRNQGFFIQDAWQAHRRLTLNLGIRFENEFLPPYKKEVDGKPVPNPISFGWGDKIAPRIGVAYDVLGNGNWKLSGSFGIFFDTMKYELARGSFGGDFWVSHVYRLNDPDLNKLGKASPGVLGPEIINFDNRTVPINAQGQLDGIDPDIKATRSAEFTISSAHQLGNNNIFSMRYTRKRLYYGIEDIGTLDANESEVYVIGNPGYGLTDYAIKSLSGDPLTPRAVREYDGLEFRLDGRMTERLLKGFSYNASYTYSKLYGNWAGLANSDENGRSDPNVSRAFDLFYSNFDSKGRNVYGRLATDRPHTFKFFGNYEWNWKPGSTVISLSQIAYSGTPLTSEVTFIVPVFYNGRGDLGRTPTLTQTDLLFAHTVRLSERASVKFDANVRNLFNQGIEINRTVRLNRSGSISLTDEQFFAGFDAPSLVNPVNGAAPALNAIYNLPLEFQGIRNIRLGVHFQF
jgi:hypothetical protein